jgi:hypothetical protein
LVVAAHLRQWNWNVMAADNSERFHDFVLVTLQGRRMLDEDEERALVADGIARFDLDATLARGTVSSVATAEAVVLAREVSRHMLDILQGLASKKGRVTRAEFRKGVSILRALTRGAVDEKKAKAWLKRVVTDSDIKPGRGGWLFTRRWFRRIRMTA